MVHAIKPDMRLKPKGNSWCEARALSAKITLAAFTPRISSDLYSRSIKVHAFFHLRPVLRRCLRHPRLLLSVNKLGALTFRAARRASSKTRSDHAARGVLLFSTDDCAARRHLRASTTPFRRLTRMPKADARESSKSLDLHRGCCAYRARMTPEAQHNSIT